MFRLVPPFKLNNEMQTVLLILMVCRCKGCFEFVGAYTINVYTDVYVCVILLTACPGQLERQPVQAPPSSGH